MKVLVACEYSGVVRRAFAARGHKVISCDLLHAEDNSPDHVQGDVLGLLSEPWDLLIAHPPCTRLCNSGVRWLGERNLWAELDKACAFFLTLLNAPVPKIAFENPTMHRHAFERIGVKPDFAIQPWQFGHGETKRTRFWTKGLPPLVPTNIVDGRAHKVHKMPPSPERWRERSRTYEGVGAAMADQYG